MEFSPSDFIRKRRNEKHEVLATKYLRSLQPEERHAFIWEILKSDDNITQAVGCKMVTKTVQDNDFLCSMLQYAIENCDVSTIKFWLIPPIKKLGVKRTLNHLIDSYPEHPDIVNAACYHLHWLLTEKSDKVTIQFEQLKEVCGFDSQSL